MKEMYVKHEEQIEYFLIFEVSIVERVNVFFVLFGQFDKKYS